MLTNFSYFIGIDVSKDKVDIFSTETSSHFTVSNSKKAIRHALYNGFDREKTLVILETTGGYENVCIETLINIGFKIHRANNNSVKHFIRYNGIRAKTDKIDAEALALFGEFTQNNPKSRYSLTEYVPLTETQDMIRQNAYYIQHLKRFRASLKNRFKSPGCVKMRESIETVLNFVTSAVETAEKDLEYLMKEDPAIRNKYELMLQYKGIGKTSAMDLIAFLPELGTIEKKHIVALSGLAPYAKDSGKMSGYRTTRGNGRPIVKRILFMATLSGTRYNEDLANYYKSKTSQGKKKMVAMTACMRKMIVQLNAITKRGSVLY